MISAPNVARRSAPRHRGCVAPLEVADVDRVTDLHGRAFGAGRSRAALTSFLTQIFFEHPWRDESLPSLGYFDRSGMLVGCLGVMPRPMTFRDRAVRAVVTHNFMVDAANRGGLTAIQLMRSLIDRAPDLVLADGNASARRICEAIGGKVVGARSARWLRVLRPAGLGVHFLSQRLAPSIGQSMRAVAALPDAIATHVARMNGRGRPLEGADADMWGGRLAVNLARLTQRFTLRPIYSEISATWLLDRLRATQRDQVLRARDIHVEGEVVGWYVYYSRRHGVGRVLQLGATEGSRSLVLSHLFADALSEGNVGLSGDIDPAWARDLERASCLFRPGSTSMLAYTSDEGIHQALATEGAFLSRLEGEGWLRFGY